VGTSEELDDACCIHDFIGCSPSSLVLSTVGGRLGGPSPTRVNASTWTSYMMNLPRFLKRSKWVWFPFTSWTWGARSEFFSLYNT